MKHVRYILRNGILFVGSLFVATLINIVLWRYFIHGVIYYKAPFFYPGGMDYIMWVGNWIHEGASRVKEIDTTWTFKDPQQVIEGWTNRGLMVIWVIMLISSLAFSVLCSWWLGKDNKTLAESGPGE